eukprot:92460-Pyramimonas_sp.AAC.1
MDTWAGALNRGLAVAFAAGSNAAAYRPALVLLAAHRNNKLAPNAGFPAQRVRLAKDHKAARELAELTSGGHYQKANGRFPHRGGFFLDSAPTFLRRPGPSLPPTSPSRR